MMVEFLFNMMVSEDVFYVLQKKFTRGILKEVLQLTSRIILIPFKIHEYGESGLWMPSENYHWILR